VGDASGQDPDGPHLVGLEEFPLDAFELGDVDAQFHDQGSPFSSSKG
jgi:hypothetical protein